MLILAEKPSVAKAFASALNAPRDGDGFYQNKHDNIIITNCVGHLYELAKPQDYDDRYRKWSLDNLPIMPDRFTYLASESTKKQTALVTRLLRECAREKIVIATDADREGEVIARIVLQEAGIRDTSNCWRFWVSEALTTDVIRKGMGELRPWSEYDALAAQGFARQRADWLVGMNFSPYVTLVSGNSDTFSVGRVQTAILAAVAQRNNEVRNFVAEPYWEGTARLVDGNGNRHDALLVNPDTDRTVFNSEGGYLAEAKSFADGDRKITVTADIKRKSMSPPRLLSLTQLQKIAARDFGFSAARTLELAQRLYEEYKCMSYPRTPSSVMGDDDVPLFSKIFGRLRDDPHARDIFGGADVSALCDESLISATNRHIFNSKKLDSHHALIPLEPFPSDGGADERRIYDTVTRHFFLACMPACVYDEKKISVMNGKYLYRTTVSTVVSPGWKAASAGTGDDDKDNELTVFDETSANMEGCDIVKKFTKPKKEFTEATLLAFMENPTGQDGEGKLAGLGTPATRGSILKKLEDMRYVERQGKKFMATQKGFFLLKLLFRNELTSQIAKIGQTTKWEQQLADSPAEFERSIRDYVRQCVSVKTDSSETYQKEGIGKCPLCGRQVYESAKNFYCSGYKAEPKCQLTIWKSVSGAAVSASDAKTLLGGGKTGVKKMKNREGKEFQARLQLVEGAVKFVFDETKKAGKGRDKKAVRT